MLNMSDINHIRDLHQSGYKISEIHEKTGADPKTIKKYLEKEDFYDAAVNALVMSLKNGNVNSSDARIIAQRITGYGIDTPPESGPSLKVYDLAFLQPREGGAAS